MTKFLALSVSVLALTACATDPNTGERIWGDTARGAAIGAVGGAAIGVLAGGDDGRNAAVGAAIGAIAGAAVGGYMDKQEAELRKVTQGTGIEVNRVGDQIELRMPSDVTFASNESKIQTHFFGSLDQVAASLNNYPSTTVDIIGHADSDGSESYNQVLSERRAYSVRDYLAAQGLNTIRMVALGRGELEPIAPNDTANNKAKNRRVQIVLTPVRDEA